MNSLSPFTQLADGRVVLQIDAGAGGLIIGRAEAEGEYAPDLDLAPFNGQGLGVSRRHAALVRYHERLHLVDLDSANGTFLGGQRLPPNVPVRLRDGDHVRLGSLTLVISIGLE
jgi:pSer/pThr/pTyr-binding forkhead associated (FHA) protein